MPAESRTMRQGLRYRYHKQVKGERLFSPFIYKTKKEAEDAERGAVSAFLQGKKIPSVSGTTSETVSELLTRRLEFLKFRRSAHHFARTQNLFKRGLSFVPEWADLTPSEITAEMVMEWADKWAKDLHARGKTAYDVNKCILAFQGAWNAPWGMRRGPRTYPVNPFSMIEWLPVEHRDKFIPSRAIVEKVLDAVKGLDRLYLEIMATTGARPGEARELKWDDVTDAQITLYTRKKKGGHLRPRKLPITPELAETLRAYRVFNPDAVYVFQQDGLAAPHVHSWTMKIQKKACKGAGVRYFTPHSWRHFYASNLAKEGVPLPEIQARLGHEAATTTDIYLHELGVY